MRECATCVVLDRGCEMSRRKIIPYDPRLKELARHLRKNMTPAEKKLWSRIRRKQVGGYCFYRQRPIDQYIVDFYCPYLQLVIEVDGRSHVGDGKMNQDLDRQHRLENVGLHIICFSDQDVLHDMENVIRAIGATIAKIERRTSP